MSDGSHDLVRIEPREPRPRRARQRRPRGDPGLLRGDLRLDLRRPGGDGLLDLAGADPAGRRTRGPRGGRAAGAADPALRPGGRPVGGHGGHRRGGQRAPDRGDGGAGDGVFALYRDPGGVVAGAWEERFEGEVPEGGVPKLTDEVAPGNLVHFELYTEDPAATAAFHEAVFGWTFEPVEAGGYTMARPPTPRYGGLMPASDGWPAGALVYLLVDSAEDAVGTVRAAGGTVLREPFEVEGWGTMAVFEAPGGVVGAVWEPAPASADRPAAEVSESEAVTD